MSILDLFFPKYCVNCKKLGSYICADCFSFISFTTAEKCLVCNRNSIDGLTHPYCRTKYTIDGSFTGIEYKGIVKKLIYQFKYDPFVSDLKNVLCELFYESLIQKEVFMNILNSHEDLIFVPIPLHPSRFKKRGYNQSEILGIELGKRFNISCYNMLERVRQTRSQYGLKREERTKNMKGAFSLSSNILISRYPNIFLIDDILTTGSTLSEAGRTLKLGGVKKVWAISFAQD